MAPRQRVFARFVVVVFALWLLIVFVGFPGGGSSNKTKKISSETSAHQNTGGEENVKGHHNNKKKEEHISHVSMMGSHYRKGVPQNGVGKHKQAQHEDSDVDEATPPAVMVRQQHPGSKEKGKTSKQTNLDEKRRNVVVEALKLSWHGYKTYAWGKDEFFPIAKQSRNWADAKEPMGATIIDALDTLIIAEMDDEVQEIIDWVEKTLSFNIPSKISMFETTIRILGGLLSAYQRTLSPVLLQRARELGERLLPAFETGSGIPDNYVNLQTHHHEGAGWNGGAAILSEFGSLQLEFRTLTRLTGNKRFDNAATNALKLIRPNCYNGMCARNYHGAHGTGGAPAGLGSFGDSFYEYLLKQWILSGRTDNYWKAWWDEAANHLMSTSSTVNDFLIPNGVETHNTMEHLACFSAGLFALDYFYTKDAAKLEFGEKIAATCHHLYQSQPTRLAPDVVVLMEGQGDHIQDPKYILRPETVESYFYLWKVTKDEKYRDWGFEVIQAVNQHLKVENVGYAGASDVRYTPPLKNDNMETFWFAETLKYLYLLFSEDEAIDLEKWVFNTEAHPLRIFGTEDGELKDHVDNVMHHEKHHSSSSKMRAHARNIM